MGPTSSTVRGRNSKSDSTTREAISGSATTCFISWQRTAATSWGLTCRHSISPGTTPSTVRSLYQAKRTTTRCKCPDIQVTSSMDSVIATIWCSPRMIVTTIGGLAATLAPTVRWSTAVDSGTRAVHTAPSPLLSLLHMTRSGGRQQGTPGSTWSPLACGWCARSVRWLCSQLWFTLVTTSRSRNTMFAKHTFITATFCYNKRT